MSRQLHVCLSNAIQNHYNLITRTKNPLKIYTRDTSGTDVWIENVEKRQLTVRYRKWNSIIRISKTDSDFFFFTLL